MACETLPTKTLQKIVFLIATEPFLLGRPLSSPGAKYQHRSHKFQPHMQIPSCVSCRAAGARPGWERLGSAWAEVSAAPRRQPSESQRLPPASAAGPLGPSRDCQGEEDPVAPAGLGHSFVVELELTQSPG